MGTKYLDSAKETKQDIIDGVVDALAADLGDFSAQSNLKSLLAMLGSGWNTADKTLYALLYTDLLGHATNGLANIAAQTEEKVAGKIQPATMTESLNQALGTYDLFVGTTQKVLLKSLVINMPTGAAGGAITSISIQTDAATPQVIISAVQGAVANLTSEAQLAWTGAIVIPVGTKIQLTIAGGAHGSAYTATIDTECEALVSGGYLA